MGFMLNGSEITSALEEAIAIAGGPKQLAAKVGLSYKRIHQILHYEGGEVQRVPVAKRIAAVTGVPAPELCGLMPWRGPERHDGAGGGAHSPRRRRAPRRGTVRPLRPAAVTASADPHIACPTCGQERDPRTTPSCERCAARAAVTAQPVREVEDWAA